MNKIKLIQIIGFLLISNNIFSQDLIFLKNGEEIKSKVIEIDTLKIKYKEFSNLEGPIYTIMKYNVFIIKYENGEDEIFYENNQEINEIRNSLRIDFKGNIFQFQKNKFWNGENKISKSKFKSIIRKNLDAKKMYQFGNNLRGTSIILGVPFVLAFGSLLENLIRDYNDVSLPAFIIVGAGIVGAIMIENAGINKIRESLNIYNKGIYSLSFTPIINANGVGLAINF